MTTSGLVAELVGPSSPFFSGFLWLLAAALLLDFFDISLPRGDSTGVAGALFAAASVLIGPVLAGAIMFLSAVLAHVARRGTALPMRLAGILVSRGAALCVGSLSVVWLSAPQARAFLYVFAPAAFLATEFFASQVFSSAATHRPFFRLLGGSLVSQAPLIAAQWSASVLLLITYAGMGSWSLIPVVVLLLLMRQSYSLFLDIRETYRTTVEVLVEAAESQDARRVGHADRTAMLARSIATKVGLSAAEVERISYVALLHDLGELAEGTERDSIHPERRASSADIVRGVEFFKGVEPGAPCLRRRRGSGVGRGLAGSDDCGSGNRHRRRVPSRCFRRTQAWSA